MNDDDDEMHFYPTGGRRVQEGSGGWGKMQKSGGADALFRHLNLPFFPWPSSVLILRIAQRIAQQEIVHLSIMKFFFFFAHYTKTRQTDSLTDCMNAIAIPRHESIDDRGLLLLLLLLGLARRHPLQIFSIYSDRIVYRVPAPCARACDRQGLYVPGNRFLGFTGAYGFYRGGGGGKGGKSPPSLECMQRKGEGETGVIYYFFFFWKFNSASSWREK